MLAPGTPAPDFSLPDQDGASWRLSEALSQGPLILYFYPADFTPGCTMEAQRFRDMETELVEAGLQVVGVSPQGPESHCSFRERHGLGFTLLADEDKAAIRQYEADGPLGIGVRRITYSIDADGRILDALIADLRIGRHEAFVRAAIEARTRTAHTDLSE